MLIASIESGIIVFEGALREVQSLKKERHHYMLCDSP
jgi:hypothetical protein